MANAQTSNNGFEKRPRGSTEKRLRVRAVIEAMVTAGERVTFTEVSRRAKVSRTLLYEADVRPIMEQARGFTSGPPRRPNGEMVGDLAALTQCLHYLAQQQQLLVRRVDFLAEQIKWQHAFLRNTRDGTRQRL